MNAKTTALPTSAATPELSATCNPAEPGNLASNTRLLNRFYGIFAVTCIGMLSIGVPFFFIRKAGSAAVCLILLAAVAWCWRLSCAGQPQRSLTIFSAVAWFAAVGMLYFGTQPTIVVFIMAIAVVLAVVTRLRVGVLFGVTYLLAWLGYLLMVRHGVAPQPYFLGGTFVSWFHAVASFLLVLLPVPELVSSIRAAGARQQQAERHLRETLASNDAILLHSPVAMGVYRSSGSCVMVNQAYASLVGASVAQLMKQDFRTIETWQRSGLGEDIIATLADGAPRRRRIHETTSFGREIWIDIIMMSTILGGAPHILLQFVDYTEQKLSEEALKKSEQRLAMALHASALSTWEFNIATGTVEIDAQWATIIGAPAGRTVTTVMALLARTHPDDIARLRHEAVLSFKGEIVEFQCEFRVRTEAGEWRWICCSGKIIARDERNRAMRAIGTNLDINERKVAQERIRQLAYYDSLTDLPNRRMLLDRLNQALAHARRHRRLLAVMYLDLDNFKLINDTLGHNAGDVLLQEVARRISGCARAGDTVSRQGGDEFVIVLTEITQPADAAAAANKIFAALAVPLYIGGEPWAVTTSLGICVALVDNTDDAQSLMKKADSAMYEAKRSGRNQYRFFQEASALQETVST